MTAFVRFLHILRRGPGPRRTQAMAGLGLVVVALVWMVFNLWIVLVFFAAFLLGLYLISRAVREPPPPSSSSSSS